MDADTLRALQAPLKKQYKEHPETALTPLRAEGDLASPGITAQVGTWAGTVRAGLHRATGGNGEDACSGDMLLEALVACAAVTLRSVATALGVAFTDGAIEATSTFDARGTLGVARDVPVGIGPVTLRATLATEADDATLERLATMTERYCVVGQSLAVPPRIEVTRA